MPKRLTLKALIFFSILWTLCGANATELPINSYSSIKLSPPGAKPQQDGRICKRSTVDPKTWQASSQDEAAIESIIKNRSSTQFNVIFSLVPEEVVWWTRLGNEIDLVSLPRAFHEASHAIDFQLTKCNNKATYLFDGHAYVTDLVRGSTPPYPTAASEIPQILKTNRLGRYTTYFEKTPPLPGNDFSTLIEELNAYLIGAQLELELAKTKLYSDVVDSKKYESYDGNIQGVADFMFYALCYLKMAREKYPEAYLRIKGSPRFINYMQRLWMSSEKTLSNAKVYSAAHGGVYYINQSNLDAMYSPTYISELDLLKISHAENISVR